MDQALLDSAEETDEALSQIRTVLSGYYDLFQDQRPDRDTLESALCPHLAAGFLNSGYGSDDLISLLADNDESGPVNERFVGCSLYRPMTEQYYGPRTLLNRVEEIPDNYSEGAWILATSEINGEMITWISSFVKLANDTWKWYGNRRPFRRSSQGRPEARQFIFPADAVLYHSGLWFWHNDVGNIALNMGMGITNLAIFNPAFAPETIDGTPTNCIRMERREEGLDTRFSLTNVPTFWRDDALYQIGPGRGLDIATLASQESKEFVVIGLDENDMPVSTWIYTIAQLPPLVEEIISNPDHYFADIEQTSISFEPYDPADPDNPDAFPGNDGLFSWVLPDDAELFPSHSHLGWNDDKWYWNEIQIDNPAWYSAGDFRAWTSDTYQPGPLADIVREAQFSIFMRNANNNQYRTSRWYNPRAENVIDFEDGELVFNLFHEYLPENLSDRVTAFTRITGRPVTRFETDLVVEDGAIFDTSDNAIDVIAETSIRLAYHPNAYYVKDVGTGYVELVVRISLYKDGNLSALGYIWTADEDWDTDQYVDSYSELFVGNFPTGSPALVFGNPYSIAVEFDEANNKFIIELDGQSSAFDLAPYPEFDPQTFKYAEIRTRVKNLAQEGDAGKIIVHYDNVMVNGALYDDFADGFSTNKWYVNAYE